MAFPTGYSLYQTDDTNNSLVFGTHSDKYYLYDLSALANGIADIFDTCRSDFGDIRITLADGSTQLAWGLISGDKSGKTGKILIKIPSLIPSIDMTIYFWYNGIDIMPAADSTYGYENVWNSDIKGAFTMEDNTTSSILDLTGNSLDGTKSSANNPLEATGYIHKAQDFSSDIIDLGDTTLLDGATGISLTTILNFDSRSIDNAIIRKWAAGQQAFSLGVSAVNNDELQLAINDSSQSEDLTVRTTSANLVNSTDYLVKGVWRGTNDIDIYVNGSSEVTTISKDRSPSSIPNVSERLGLGARYNAGSPDLFFDGKMSLAILSTAEDSDDWATTEYNNIFNTSSFWHNPSAEQDVNQGDETPIPIINPNINWDQKPQAWGNQSDVSSNLKDRLENIGIAYDDCALAMPMWNPGDQIDYSKNNVVGININAGYEQNSISFNGTTSYLTLLNSNPISTTDVTLLTITIPSSLAGYPTILGKWQSNDNKQIKIVHSFDGNGVPYVDTSTTGSNDVYRSLNSSLSVGDRYVLCGRLANSASLDIFLNGILSNGSLTGAVGNINSSTVNMSVAAEFNSEIDPVNFFSGIEELALLFNSSLSDDQISSLSENPWQLWQKPSYTFYSFATSDFVIRELTSTINSTISATDISIIVERLLNSIINNTISTADISTIIERLLTSVVINTIMTSDISVIIERLLESIVVNTITSSDISVIIERLFTSIVNSTITASNISVKLERLLISTISSNVNATTINLNIERLLESIINSTITASDISVIIERLLTSTISSTITTSDIDLVLEAIKALYSVINSNVTTSDIDVNIERLLETFINSNVTTSDIVLFTTAIKALYSVITSTVTTTDSDVNIERLLTTEINVILNTSDVLLQILRALETLVESDVSASDINLDVERLLSSIIINSVSSSDITLDKLIKLISNTNITTSSSEVLLEIIRELSSSINNTVTSEESILKILRELNSTIDINILTTDILLLLEILGVINRTNLLNLSTKYNISNKSTKYIISNESIILLIDKIQ